MDGRRLPAGARPEGGQDRVRNTGAQRLVGRLPHGGYVFPVEGAERRVRAGLRRYPGGGPSSPQRQCLREQFQGPGGRFGGDGPPGLLLERTETQKVRRAPVGEQLVTAAAQHEPAS